MKRKLLFLFLLVNSLLLLFSATSEDYYLYPILNKDNEINFIYLKSNDEKDGFIVFGSFFTSSNIDLVIPDEYNSLPIIEIADSAFDSNKSISSLVLPNSIRRIGDRAFYNCSNIKGELMLPSSLEEIGDEAFANCTSLYGELVLPSKLKRIGKYGLANTNFSGRISIPHLITTIEEGTFYNCSSFCGELVLPECVVSIDQYSFAYCSNLSGDLFIPKSIEFISENAFIGCSGLNGHYFISESKKMYFIIRDL